MESRELSRPTTSSRNHGRSLVRSTIARRFARHVAIVGWISEMKLSHKIGKLAQPVTYRRAWRRAQRVIFPLPIKPLLASIDQQRLRGIQQRHAGLSAEYAKYADVDHWLRDRKSTRLNSSYRC